MQVLTELDTHTERHHPHTCGGPGSPADSILPTLCAPAVWQQILQHDIAPKPDPRKMS